MEKDTERVGLVRRVLHSCWVAKVVAVFLCTGQPVPALTSDTGLCMMVCLEICCGKLSMRMKQNSLWVALLAGGCHWWSRVSDMTCPGQRTEFDAHQCSDVFVRHGE